MALTYDAWKTALAGERLPAAVIDLDAFDRNAAALEQMAQSKKIRLATKSVRVPALIKRVLDRGDAWQGLMCFCTGEAVLLAAQGFDDLLVAYPTVQRAELEELRQLVEDGRNVTLVVDSREGMDAAERVMEGSFHTHSPLRVAIELDVAWRPFGLTHIGVRRSPVRTPEQLADLLRYAGTHEHIRVVGVMAYEAHIAGLPDRNPFHKLMSPAFRAVRRLSVKPVARAREAVAQVFADAGVPLELFNGGGTGSLTWAAGEEHLTEVTTGSGLICSHLFDYYSNFHLEPAGGFALQVVRAPGDRYVTCQGGGYVASGEPGWDRVPRPWQPPGLELVSAEAAGEVQTPVRLPKDSDLGLGDPILFRHAKAGELAERFDHYLLVRDDTVVERAPTYRGLGATFP